ncbi:TetR/AcrR family transcriptional regulator [Streptomyces acidiscabies]|uniref:TetR/AcrR family transcriptional regulator n=1 Tax=Streptomyces acidiscabies TaxID=42234 RepID=UPI00067DCE81|nr:TetR/AcrR family transcriptional regulator [Streptomyces acidiscabies]
MPKFVDHDVRRREIVRATLEVLAESGTAGLSFRAVAARLGGSTTLVTHYFPHQDALLAEVASYSLVLWGEEIDALDRQGATPTERLQNLLVWLMPVTPVGLMQERARINLLSSELLGEGHRTALEEWDVRIRSVLRNHLEELVPHDQVDKTVELLRVTISGVVLTVVEHPGLWPIERQLAIVEHLMQLLAIPVDRRGLGEVALSLALADR